MQDLKFNVVNRPSKETPGVTEVITRVFESKDRSQGYVDTVVGQLHKVRGAAFTGSVLVDGNLTAIDGTFKTRSQAGHAVRDIAQADIRAERKTAREAMVAAKATKTVADTEQAKKDARNAKRRAQRAAAKAA